MESCCQSLYLERSSNKLKKVFLHDNEKTKKYSPCQYSIMYIYIYIKVVDSRNERNCNEYCVMWHASLLNLTKRIKFKMFSTCEQHICWRKPPNCHTTKSQTNSMWSSLSVTYGRSGGFSGDSGFLHQYNWSPRYNWNIVEMTLNTINPKQAYLLEEKRYIQSAQLNFFSFWSCL